MWLNKVFNDDEEDLQAQESWGDRPYRWLPEFVEYPAAVIGGTYREIKKAINSRSSPKREEFAKKDISKFTREVLKQRSNQGRKESVLIDKKDPTLNKSLSVKFTMPRKKRGNRKPRPAHKKKGKAIRKIRKALGNVPVKSPFAMLATKLRAGRKRVEFNSMSRDMKKRFVTEQKVHRGKSTVSFTGSNIFSDGLVIRGRQRLGQVISVSGFSQPVILYDVTRSTSRSDTILPINPSMLSYYSEPMTVLTQVFTKFLFSSISLDYETQSPTSTYGKAMLAYSPDVDYLEGLGYSGTTPLIAQPDVVKLPNCLTFPFWEDTKYTVPVRDNLSVKQFYVRNEYSNQTGAGGAYVLDNFNDTAEDRQSFQGMLFISGAKSATDDGGTIFGDIYINYTLHLGGIGASQIAGVTPVPNSVSDSDRKFRIRYERMRALDERKALEEQKEAAARTFGIDRSEVRPVEEIIPPVSLTRNSVSGTRESSSRSSSLERKSR